MKIREIGLLLFYDWLDRMEDLPSDEFKSAVYALAEYQRKGTDPVEGFIGSMRVLVGMMLDQIKRAESISSARAAGGKASAEKRGFCSNSVQANDNNVQTQLEQKSTTHTHTHTHTNTLISPPISPPTEQKAAPQKASGDAPSADVDVIEQRFDRFWEEYPNKTGKQAARVAWRKIKPSEKLTCQMIEKLREMKKTVQWVREGGRFVPNPATWLNQGRWEDEAPKEQVQAAQAQAQPRVQTAPQKERFGNFDHEQAFIAALKRSAVGLGMNEAEAEEFAKQHV